MKLSDIENVTEKLFHNKLYYYLLLPLLLLYDEY